MTKQNKNANEITILNASLIFFKLREPNDTQISAVFLN